MPLFGHVIDQLLQLWRVVCEAVARAPEAALARQRNGNPLRTAQGALAVRLGNSWAAPGALRADAHFAALETRASPVFILGFIEVDPWVHVGVLRGALQPGGGGGAGSGGGAGTPPAAPAAAVLADADLTPEGFVDAYFSLGAGADGAGGGALGDALLPI